MDITGAASGAVAGGSSAATTPTPQPAIGSIPPDPLIRVRTRGDLAALINAGSDNITIKSEICGEGDEPMDEDGGNDVICVVNLDERNRIISMDDPFGPDDNYVYEEEGEELLDESEGEGEDQDGEDQQEGGEADGQDPEIQAEPTLQVPEHTGTSTSGSGTGTNGE